MACFGLSVVLAFSCISSYGDCLSDSLPPESPPFINAEVGKAPSKQLSILLVTGLYPSHLFPMVSLGEELVRRGHLVTLCANVMNGTHLYPDVPERVGIEFVSAGFDPFTQDEFDEMHMAMQRDSFNLTIDSKILHIAWSSMIQIRDKIEEIGVNHFDILVVEATTFPVAVYFHRKGVKNIVVCPFMNMFPSAIPNWPTPMPNSGQLEDLSFLERLFNTLLSPLLPYFVNEIYLSMTRVDIKYRQALEGIDTLFYPGLHMPLIFTTVFGIEFPKPRYPLIEYVGPILTNLLPQMDKALQDWLDTKEEKMVIYISMGTTGVLSSDTAEALLDGVMATPYYVLWVIKKRNRESLGQVNFEAFKDRLFLADWVPQQTVLQHSSILMSILHCGFNSVQESLFNSVPVICIPFAYDQYEVAAKLSSAGAGISLLTFTDALKGNVNIKTKSITSSIHSIISDHYAENASRISCMYKLAGGAKRAADLVEFYEDVGYEHLLPSFIKYEWSWVQCYNVDVWLMLVVACCVLWWILWRVGRCIHCC